MPLHAANVSLADNPEPVSLEKVTAPKTLSLRRDRYNRGPFLATGLHEREEEH
jgi:hypothetical protein